MSVFEELKRRKVFRVAAVYAATAFVTLQAADLLLPSLPVPTWTYDVLVVMGLFGFPIAVVLAWAFEVTPEGVRRAEVVAGGDDVDEAPSGGPYEVRHLLAVFAAGLLVAAVGYGGYAVLVGGGGLGEAPDASYGDSLTAPADASLRDRSVAVLPLADRSPDPADAYLAGAFTDQLTSSLGRAGLHVPSRTSAERFADTTLAIPSIAAALGVGHLLEGSVQRVEDRIRVSLSLIDAEDNRPLWQEEFERTFSDVLELQSEIARQVAGELQSRFSHEGIERTFAGTDDPVAWDLVQRAMKMSQADAEPLLREALALDSTFATAWMMIAGSYYASRELPHWRDSARAAQERALRHARDPTLRLALRAFETAIRGEGGVSDEWLTEARRAVQEFPSDALLVSLLASVQEDRGELAEAVRWTRRWVTLDPMSSATWQSLGRLYRQLELGEAAERALRRSLELAAGSADRELFELYRNQGRYGDALQQAGELGSFGRLARGAILNWSGEVEQGREILEKAFSELDFATTYSWAPELIYARQVVGDTAGNADLLARTERRALERAELDSNLRWSLVQLAALRGDLSLAATRLEEYVDGGYRDAWTLRRDPILAEARTASAFAAALAALTETIEEARAIVRRMPDETERL